jgi:cysteine desulfurase
MKNLFGTFFNTKGARRIYLDHAGATPLSRLAEAALIEGLEKYGNASAIHREGVEAGQLLDKARIMCANVLNAHAYEIYFVSSGTESCNVAILGTFLGSKKLKVKSEKVDTNALPHIITTVIEHPAVLEPIKNLEREGKVRVTYIRVDESGVVKVKDIREALCEETILVSVMYANNEIGTLQPVKEIGRAIEEWKKEHERSHTAYPYYHVDACQAANYCNLDVVRLRAHLMTVNSSKCYGPKGIALLYKREGIRIEPIVYGGGQERQLRSGTEAVQLAYAFGVALREAKELQDKEVWRLQLINDYCRAELIREIPSIVFYGIFDEVKHGKPVLDAEDESLPRNDAMKEHTAGRMMKRLPNNINCRVPGISSEEMILRLDALGFAVSHKSACASSESNGSYVLEALGVDKQEALENIRITFGRSTKKRDIEKLVKGMKEIAKKYTLKDK